MGWYDALDAQTELVDFWSSETGIRFGLSFQQSLHNKMANEGGSALPIIQIAKLRAAEPIYVNDEVLDLIEHAAEGFEPEPLLEPDLLVPYGFVLLPRAVSFTDINGHGVAFRAFCWGTCEEKMVRNDRMWQLRAPGASPEAQPGSGIYLSLYSHRDDEDWYTRQTGRLPLKWSLAHVTPWSFGRDLLDGTYREGEVVGDYGALSAEQAQAAMEGNKSIWQLVQVMFRLAQQHVLVAPKERPPRPYRRRAAKLDLPESVTVMHLRAGMLAPSDYEGEGESHYSHRFMVGGHWRWQWYPSEKAHRQVWINPFIKGPKDRPLILKRRAINFVR